MNTMSAEDIARSDGYFEGGYWLILWNFLIGMGVAWLVLGGKRSARLRDWLGAKISAKLVTPAYIIGIHTHHYSHGFSHDHISRVFPREEI